MNQLVTQSIVLTRVNYGEADRILTLLTPDQGKIRLIAKGVRRVKSKLAGGIELFSVSEIVYVRGKSDIGTLVSSRLKQHYAGIVADINRTMLGYELIKQLNKATEDECGPEYFVVLEQVLIALAEPDVPPALTEFWFDAQMLRLAGHTPDLFTDGKGKKLAAASAYTFSLDDMAFRPVDSGNFTVDHIKFLRLVFSGVTPTALLGVGSASELTQRCKSLVESIGR